MKISLYPPLFIHEIGNRNNQEDALWPLQPTVNDRLFVLCDGMGGHEHGEVASQTVTQALGKWFAEHIDASTPLTDDQLREAIEYAYQQLDQYADGSPKQMGTTLTLLYIHRQGVTAAHIGDSRIYHIRPFSSPIGGGREGAILYQSRDHSLVFDLFQAGEISYEEMQNYPQKNIVTRAMTPGKDNRMRPDIIHITDIQPGDYFFMCSDGMLEQMNNDILVSILTSNVSEEEKRQQLIVATVKNQDNHSSWLIHVKDIVKEDNNEYLVNEEPTTRCNAINIIPKAKLENDDDDVVIISEPPAPPMKKNKWIRIGLLFLAVIFVLIIVWTLFFQSKEKPELQCPKPTMQTPISPRFNNDTININQSIQNESAGN